MIQKPEITDSQVRRAWPRRVLRHYQLAICPDQDTRRIDDRVMPLLGKELLRASPGVLE